MTATDRTSIAAQVEELQEGMATQLPAEQGAAFAAEQADLAATGAPAGTARPGTPMPDGDLLDAHGEPTTLERARAGRPAVVVFYRGAWCPYCNVALRAYEAQLRPELAAKGVELVAISPQKPDGSLTMQETNELTFTVLSDPGNRVAAQLGILTSPSDGARAAQQALGLDITTANADGSTTLPMPTTVLVDAAGTIRWIDVHPDYTTRSESDDVLAAVAEVIG